MRQERYKSTLYDPSNAFLLRKHIHSEHNAENEVNGAADYANGEIGRSAYQVYRTVLEEGCYGTYNFRPVNLYVGRIIRTYVKLVELSGNKVHNLCRIPRQFVCERLKCTYELGQYYVEKKHQQSDYYEKCEHNAERSSKASPESMLAPAQKREHAVFERGHGDIQYKRYAKARNYRREHAQKVIERGKHTLRIL